MMPPSSSTDRNLLFLALALRLGMISREALADAVASTIEDDGKSIEQILIERKALTPGQLAEIDEALTRHVDHGDERTHATTAFDAPPKPAPPLLETLSDPDLDADATLVDASRDAPASSDTETDFEADSRAPAPSMPHAPSPMRYQAQVLYKTGGLGAVYRALDDELKRDVALKEILPAFANNRKARARFVREAEINANLEHPGIVPVHGSGVHPDGRPFYAMRFVQGETLQDALERFHEKEALGLNAARWALAIRPLLRRFLDVCDAVGYANSRNIIHRDLKPPNILLGPFGETLIIDWGLAKRIGQPHPGDEPDDDAIPGGDRDQSPEVGTLDGEMLGSPPYMSPEQAKGLNDELDQSTDVYSLGATLFTLLAGRPPVGGKTAREILAKVVDGKLDILSAVNPRVPRALGAICLKAMRLDPKDRYPTARALAADVEHWLADQPVSVHRDSLTTRMIRWSRHNKPLVAASLATLLFVTAGLGIGVVVAHRQKLRAEESRRQAREDLRSGLETLDELVTLGDREILRQSSAGHRDKFLKAAMLFIQRFHQRIPDDLTVQARTAMVARRLANLNALMGRFREADAFFAEAVSLLVPLEHGVGTDAHSRKHDPKYSDQLAEAYIDQSDVFLRQGKVGDAEGAAGRALVLAMGNADLTPDDPLARRTLARAKGQVGAVDLERGDPRAEEWLREAAETIRPLAEAALPTLSQSVLAGATLPLMDQTALVGCWIARADALPLTPPNPADPAEAATLLDDAVRWMDKVAAAFPGTPIPDVVYAHALARVRLARVLTSGSEDARAFEQVSAAVPQLEGLVARDNEVVLFRVTLADALAARAHLHLRAGRLAQADSDTRAARNHLRPFTEDAPADRPRIPESFHILAEVYSLRARLALAYTPPRDDPARIARARAVDAATSAVALNPENPSYRRRLDAEQARLAPLPAGAEAKPAP